MPNYKNIFFEDKEKIIDTDYKDVNALTPVLAHWGNITLPTFVTKNTLIDKFGNYDSDNEDEWMQAYNFLTYSDNLEIFRISDVTPVPTFDGVTDYLTSVDDIGHAHLFINNISDPNEELVNVWHQTDNGSSLIFKKNDDTNATNEPNFATDQLMLVYAKYAGEEGNNIGISTASYLDDLKTSYVFKEYYEIQLASTSGYSVDEVIYGATSKAEGTIKRIVDDYLYVDVTYGEFVNGEDIYRNYTTIEYIDGNDIYVADATEFIATETIEGLTSGATATISSKVGNILTTTPIAGTFQVGEKIHDSADAITAIVDKDDVDENETFFDSFPKTLKVNEFTLVVTHNDIIKERHLLSLDPEDNNYIENMESDYIYIYHDVNITLSVDGDSLSDKQDRMIPHISNEKLLFGESGLSGIGTSRWTGQLEELKDKTICRSSIIFSDNQTLAIQQKIQDVVDDRGNSFAILNNYTDDTMEPETDFNSKNVAFFYNYKRQYNIFDESVSTYGITGDVAGSIVEKLNNDEFIKYFGVRNSSLKNILMINEFSDTLQHTYKNLSYNLIQRNQETFYIDGNYTTIANKNPLDTNMVMRILVIVIKKWVVDFMDNEIGKNMDKNMENRVYTFMDSVSQTVKPFLNTFSYDVKFNPGQYIVEINVLIEPSILLDTMVFKIDEIV